MSEFPITEIQSIPKIDLHRHLLGSARPETIWELCHKYKLEVGQKPLDEFSSAIVQRRRVRSLAQYIQPWDVFRAAIRDPSDVRQIALEAALDASRDGVTYVEFRSSLPGMPIGGGETPQSRIPANEYLHAIRDAFSEASGITCRLIASVLRHVVGPAKPTLVHRYAKAFLATLQEFRDDLVVGVDLTGIESGWPAILFKDFFAEARSMGLPVTIHAGETEGPEEVWAAINELGASRIGHGTSAPKDPNLVKELIVRNIVVEVCPTSSWLIGKQNDKLKHAVIECLPMIPYVICTDSPTVNSSTQSRELSLAAKISGQDQKAFVHSQFRLASQASFAPVALTTRVPRVESDFSYR